MEEILKITIANLSNQRKMLIEEIGKLNPNDAGFINKEPSLNMQIQNIDMQVMNILTMPKT
jgi:hypothetical protein